MEGGSALLLVLYTPLAWLESACIASRAAGVPSHAVCGAERGRTEPCPGRARARRVYGGDF